VVVLETHGTEPSAVPPFLAAQVVRNVTHEIHYASAGLSLLTLDPRAGNPATEKNGGKDA